MSNDYLYMGLDTETTSADPRGEIIQIGLYIDDSYTYVSDVGHRGHFYFEEGAFKVNGFTMDRVYDGKPVFEVDKELEEFINKVKRDFHVEGQHIIPVGFNVGSFDVPFVRRTFPLFFRNLSYRQACLNAIMFSKFSNEDEFKQYKTETKEKVKTEMTTEGAEHDALYDAELALRFFHCLTRY